MESELTESLLAPPALNARAEPLPWQLAKGDLELPTISLLYRFSVVLVSLAMVLLPAIYVALVGFLICAVGAYGVHAVAVLAQPHIGPLGFLIHGLAFAAGTGIGVVLIFFFVKPIFAPRSEADRPISLDNADAPRLFALVGWICRGLNAPIPSRIDVNLSPNAGAGFRSGWRSMLGNDIALVIGLPLAAALDLGQFAGVIAHELGHFSQGTAMRASCLIREINAWFHRVVHTRDRWDDLLVKASESEESGLWLVSAAYAARAGVWVGRSVLRLLMVLAQALSCLLERQMEFDADAYEFKMSGTETFIATTQRLRQLNLGLAAAQQQMLAKWKEERKLFDQLPDFIVSRANEVPAEVQERHLSETLRRRTRLFDSHPADAERIHRARAASERGVFHDGAPAASLFADFSGLSRRVTVAHYQRLLGADFSERWLVSIEQSVREAEHDSAADEAAIERYFLGLATDLLPIIVTENKSPVFRNRDTLEHEMRSLRKRMMERAPALQADHKALKAADEQVLLAVQACELRSGFDFSQADFGLDSEDLDTALSAAQRDFNTAAGRLKEFGDAGRTRLTDAIQLLRLPDFRCSMPEAEQFQEASRELVYTLSRLADAFPSLLELRRDCAGLEILLRYRERGQRGDHLNPCLERLSARLRERIDLIQQNLGQVRYPFHHTTERIFVGEYARNKEYHPDPQELLLREGRSHVAKLFALYHRLLGALVAIAEKVEHAMVGE
jgi:Zn-dependent protease with chaperone function